MPTKFEKIIDLTKWIDGADAPEVGDVVTCQFSRIDDAPIKEVRVLAIRQRFMRIFLVVTTDGETMGVATLALNVPPPALPASKLFCAEGVSVPDDLDERKLGVVMTQLGVY